MCILLISFGWREDRLLFDEAVEIARKSDVAIRTLDLMKVVNVKVMIVLSSCPNIRIV